MTTKNCLEKCDRLSNVYSFVPAHATLEFKTPPSLQHKSIIAGILQLLGYYIIPQ